MMSHISANETWNDVSCCAIVCWCSELLCLCHAYWIRTPPESPDGFPVSNLKLHTIPLPKVNSNIPSFRQINENKHAENTGRRSVMMENYCHSYWILSIMYAKATLLWVNILHNNTYYTNHYIILCLTYHHCHQTLLCSLSIRSFFIPLFGFYFYRMRNLRQSTH